MNMISRFVEWKFKLPPAKTRDIAVQHDLPIPMPDGAILYADHFYPKNGEKYPTVLVRSPYGRKGLIFEMFARPIAEQGYQVLIQSCRGTFGSGGDFYPFHHERTDGLATIAWLKQQTWYSGEFAMFGPSYLSYAQWAIAAEAGHELKALIPIVTTSEFRSVTYPGESFALDTILSWAQGMEYQEESTFQMFFSRLRHNRQLKKGIYTLPLHQADMIAAGRTVPFFQDWLQHNTLGDSYWKQSDHSATVSQVTAPAHLLSGWYDVLLPHTIACYLRLREAGHKPYLTIGPWTHGAPGLQPVTIKETIYWLNTHLQNNYSGLRKSPVRIFVMGSKEWKDFDEWPPTGYASKKFYLTPKGGLSPDLWFGSEPDRFRYDPADPTPSVGGSSLTPNSGPRNNRKLESRGDVLVYSSAPLDHEIEVIGPVQAELFIKSSLDHTDFFARLCDVDHRGKSINISDGILRLVPGSHVKDQEGIQKITIELWPTAHCFQKGHRIRLQISSGEHPRFARNPGSGEPLATATKLIPADQQVFHDGVHASAVILQVKV
jgi:putative CocE/NonD family hydrolase